MVLFALFHVYYCEPELVDLTTSLEEALSWLEGDLHEVVSKTETGLTLYPSYDRRRMERFKADFNLF